MGSPHPPELDAALALLLAERHARATAATVTHLRSAGVDVIVLKGVATAALLYGDEVRTSADIDLLVRPADRRRAASALRSLGYRREVVSPHATSWVSASRTPVDLHVTLPRSTRSPRRVWAVLDGEATVIEVGDPPQPVPVLGPAAAAVHLALHRSQGGDVDRAAADLTRAVRLLGREVWTAAAVVARELGVEGSLAWALDQVEGGPAVRAGIGLAPIPRRALPARSVREDGVRRFLRSPVHLVERARSLASLARRTRERAAR